METFIEQFEIQVDEKPSGAVIRINDMKSCIIRICSVPRELVFDEQGEMRSFIDITYPKQLLNQLLDIYEKPKNQRLSKLGEILKKS